MAKKELVRLTPFTKPQKHLNSYLNLIKRVKYLYNENDKTLRKEIEDKKIFCVCGLDELLSSKYPYYQKKFINSM